jgi:dipeptidyl aminopeptidase/acylaminoacyl peptidase
MRRFLYLSASFGAGMLLAAGADLPTPANLKPEGLPAIRQDVFDAINRYTEFRTAALLDWAPSQREILIATRFGDVPQIHRVASPGGARRQLTFFPDRVTEALYNPANSGEMLFRKDEGGGEFYQLYLDDLHTGKITLLTKGGRTRNTGPVWSRDGKTIAFTSAARDGQNADVWIEDPHNPVSARILLQTNEPGWEIGDWSADGKQMLLTMEKSAVVSEVYVLDVPSGEKHKVGPEAQEAGWFNPRFANNGQGAYAISNAGIDTMQVVYLDLDSKKMTAIGPDLTSLARNAS